MGSHRPVTLHKLSPIQSMQVSAVKVSLTAGDSARIAISTSWSTPKETSWARVSTPKETSWARVRYGPVTCAGAGGFGLPSVVPVPGRVQEDYRRQFALLPAADDAHKLTDQP